MFKFLPILFLLGSTLGGTHYPTGQCREDDERCLIRAGNRSWQAVIAGVPSLSEPLDPIYGDVIFTNDFVPGAGVGFYKPTLSGTRNCVFTGAALSIKNRTESYVVNCPKLKMTGEYQIEGQKRVEFQLTINDLMIRIDTTFSIQHRPAGKSTMQRYRYTLRFTPLGTLVEERDTDGRHFFNEHSKEIVLQFIMTYFLDIMMNRINRMTSVMPMDEVFADRGSMVLPMHGRAYIP